MKKLSIHFMFRAVQKHSAVNREKPSNADTDN